MQVYLILGCWEEWGVWGVWGVWGTRGPHDRQGVGIRGNGEVGRWGVWALEIINNQPLTNVETRHGASLQPLTTNY
ncbi:hypothetical protein [Fischerella thermalis]|uniref:hypothetical protein n=1 Tax=Fischerella thermalis TaxID=372787 RepID=UPI00307F20CB